MQRDEITDMKVALTLKAVEEQLVRKFAHHGRVACASLHEAFGVMYEELDEAAEEMRVNDKEKFKKEAIDIAVAAIWAAASL